MKSYRDRDLKLQTQQLFNFYLVLFYACLLISTIAIIALDYPTGFSTSLLLEYYKGNPETFAPPADFITHLTEVHTEAFIYLFVGLGFLGSSLRLWKSLKLTSGLITLYFFISISTLTMELLLFKWTLPFIVNLLIVLKIVFIFVWACLNLIFLLLHYQQWLHPND